LIVISRAKRLELIPPYLFGEIAALTRKAFAEGKDLVDLGIGDPDQPTPGSIIDALSQAAHNPETHRYDETNAGWTPFLEAVSTFGKRRFDIDIDPATEAMLLIGSKEGLSHLAWAYIDPGDISLVPDPAYTVYKVNTLMAGGEVHTMPLLESNGFLPDLTAIPTDVAKKAKLLWLNYPNNPTGAIAPLSFYADAVAFAQENDLLIVNDAAYSEVYYDDYRPVDPPGAGRKRCLHRTALALQIVQHDRLADRIRHRQCRRHRHPEQAQVQPGQQAVPSRLARRRPRSAARRQPAHPRSLPASPRHPL